MAFSDKRLNNIAGSTGGTNHWVYTALADSSEDPSYAGETLTTIKTANYFAGVGDYGMEVGDVITLAGSDSTGMGQVSALTATTSAIIALTAL